MGNNINNVSSIDELISRYLKGIASEEELNTLVKWMEDSDENAKYFAELAYIYSAYQTITSSKLQVEKELMLLRLNERIDSEAKLKQASKRNFRIKFIKTSLSIAAVISVIILSFFFFGRVNEKPQEEKYLTHSNSSTNIEALILDDGTKVWLHGGSILHHKINSDDGVRKVKLLGRAFFDVAKDTLHPFIVTTDVVAIKVLGTKFSVETSANGSKAKVILEKGSVRLQSLDGINLVRLHPDQMAIYDGEENDVYVEPINAKPYLVENYNKITLEEVCIDEIINHVNEIYGIKIQPLSKYDHNMKYDLNYNRTDSIEQVIDIIAVLTGVNFIITR